MKKSSTIGIATLGAVALLAVLAIGTNPRAQTKDATPWLGVYSQSLDQDLREGIGFNGAGVLVTRVLDDSPAGRAGMRKGDVITRVGNRTVDSPDALAEVVGEQQVGDRVSVRVVRDRSSRDLDVTIAARPDRLLGERRMIARDDDDEDGDDDDGGDFEHHIEIPNLKELEKLGDLGDMRGFHFAPDVDHMMLRGMGRGRLGVRIESLNPQLGSYFEVPNGKGALVIEVIDDTPAAKAGIEPGDVITKLGSSSVSDAGDLIEALRGKDGPVAITVMRHGTARTLEADLEKSKAPMARRWTSRDDSGRERKRIVVRSGRPGAPGAPGDAELRRELEDLRRELRELKEELKRD